jgi:hypothetical protein
MQIPEEERPHWVRIAAANSGGGFEQKVAKAAKKAIDCVPLRSMRLSVHFSGRLKSHSASAVKWQEYRERLAEQQRRAAAQPNVPMTGPSIILTR